MENASNNKKKALFFFYIFSFGRKSKKRFFHTWSKDIPKKEMIPNMHGDWKHQLMPWKKQKKNVPPKYIFTSLESKRGENWSSWSLSKLIANMIKIFRRMCRRSYIKRLVRPLRHSAKNKLHDVMELNIILELRERC